jgi:hypothetical protein
MVCVQLPAEHALSCQQLLSMLAECLHEQCKQVIQAEVMDKNAAGVDDCMRALGVIEPCTLVLLVPFADRLPPSTLIALEEELSQFAWKSMVVCVRSSLSAIMLTTTALGPNQRLSLPAPEELFDSVYQSLLIRGKLVLQLTSSLLRSLYNTFSQEERCVTSFINRCNAFICRSSSCL